jgi:hypothetical protein
MREGANGDTLRRSSLDAPPRDSVGARVHVDPHLLTGEKAEQVPEQMQRGREQRCTFATFQRRQLSREADGTRRRLEHDRLAGRERRPGA